MADHTGKRASKRAVRKIDTSSIKTTTLLSFVIFALFLVMILWGLSNFYLNSFYERARSQEVMRTAETLEAQFRQDRYSFGPLALQTAGTNDLYIRIDTPEDNLVLTAPGRFREATPLKVTLTASRQGWLPLKPATSVKPGVTIQEWEQGSSMLHI